MTEKAAKIGIIRDMKRSFFIGLLTVFLLSSFGTRAAAENLRPLLSPQTLADLLETRDDLRLLRISGEHAAGHIPGSIPADYARFRGPSSNPGALPSLEELTDLVQSLGLTATRPVVLVHDGASPSDMGTATRVYWTLKSLGVKELAILNGGFSAWQQAGLPVNMEPVPVAASDWSPRWHDDWQISTSQINRRLGDPDLRLIDARPDAFFAGSQSSIARPGTIRGAKSLSFDRWFDGNRMKPADEVQQILASSALADADTTTSFCNSGHWASINWFVLSELAQVPDTRLYAESMAEWTQANRAMDNQPSRVAHYWGMTMEWFDSLWQR